MIKKRTVPVDRSFFMDYTNPCNPLPTKGLTHTISFDKIREVTGTLIGTLIRMFLLFGMVGCPRRIRLSH